MDNPGEDPLPFPQEEPLPFSQEETAALQDPLQQHHQHQQQDPLQHQGLQQQAFVGFGIDPNWGGFGEAMHGHGHGHGHGQAGYHHSGMQPTALDGSQLIPGLAPSMDPLEALLGPFPCAHIRGLPFEASHEDVLVFFQGLVVIDVVMVSHEELGEAFVLFANPMDFQMGLQRDRQNMGNRYLEIFQGKRSDYYAAIASQHHHWHGVGGLLENSGVGIERQNGNTTAPPNNTGGGLSPESAGDHTKPFIPKGGTAWKKSGAPSPPHNNTMYKGRGAGSAGGYPYRGKPGNLGPREGHHGGRGGGYKRNGGGGTREGPHTGFIRLRGLPFQASKQDILDFFKEYKPIESSVILTYRVDGRATGEGYVAFDDAEVAKEAMSRHKSTIGSRYIELFISNKEEHTRSMARSTPH